MSGNEEDLPGASPAVQAVDAWAPLAEVDLHALRASALRQARRLVEFYRITPEELTGTARVEADRSVALVQERPVKFRHPVTGDTWDGVGPHPEWMRQALLKDGYRVDELRVANSTEDPHARFAA